MKRYLILAVVLLCIVPFASASFFYPDNLAQITVSSEHPNGLHPKALMFDGNETTAWWSDGGSGVVNYTRSGLKGIYVYPQFNAALIVISDSTGNIGSTTCNPGAWCIINSTSSSVGFTKVTSSQQFGYFVELMYDDGLLPVPIANFTAVPLSGTVPLTVSFTDTSTNITGGELWNWSVSPAPGVSITTPTAQNTQMTFATIGNYTISHGVNNSGGSSIKTKTNYIYVYNSTATTTLHITAINALNAYPIHGAQVNLYDVENASWSNTTTTDGTGTITSISSHTVNAYANAAGFADADKLGIPVSNVYDSILLFPTNSTSVSAGNVTLFVSVFDNDDHSKPIVGAGVTVITASSAQSQFTNSGGSAQFAVPNKSTVLIDAEAVGQGYNGATQSVYTGTGSGASASVTATIYLSKKTLTPTVTQTTLPGGGTPTPTITILPGCEDPMSAACQASQNDYSMGWLSQNGLMLIEFFVLCFIIFMFKGMAK